MSYDIRMMYRNQVKLVELLVQVPHIYAMHRVAVVLPNLVISVLDANEMVSYKIEQHLQG